MVHGHEQQGMKLPKYNLGYNTRDQLRSLAISASERKQFKMMIVEFEKGKFYAALEDKLPFTRCR